MMHLPRGVVWWLLALLVLRVAVAVLVAPSPVADAQGYEAAAAKLATTGSFTYPLMGDAYWSDDDGSLVVDAEGREALRSAPPNAYTMPGYPVFRALLMMFNGAGEESRPWTRAAQAVLSVATALFVYLIAARAGRRTGLFALGLASLYPPFTFANSYLLTEVLFTFLLAAFVWVFLEWMRTSTMARTVVLGVLFALGLLVRPSLALWLPVGCLLAVVLEGGDRRKRIRHAAAVMLVCVLAMSPWWLRNYRLYDELVVFSTSGAVTTIEAIRMDVAEKLPFPWQSAEQSADTADRAIEREIETVYARKPSTPRDDLVLQEYFDEAGASLRDTVLDEYRAEWLAARMRAIAVSLFWPHAVSPEALGGVPFRLAALAHAVLLVLAAVGTKAATSRTDRWLLVSLIAYTVALHAALIPLHRYYFPVMPFVTVLAAYGVTAIADRLRRDSGARPAPSSAR